VKRTKNPGSRAHLTRTPAQERAFRAFRLRGVYWMLTVLTGPRRELAQMMVDWELQSLGVERESERYEKRRKWYGLSDLD
jgi:hypothetical protein